MYAVTDERIGESSLTRLINEGFSPILMPPATYLQPAVSAHTDMLIFHTAICAGAPKITVMAEEKPHSRISLRPVAHGAPE
jgi:hypothetical protein